MTPDIIKDAKEHRARVLEEMKARRIDGKTYIDAEWLLAQYEKELLANIGRELEARCVIRSHKGIDRTVRFYPRHNGHQP